MSDAPAQPPSPAADGGDQASPQPTPSADAAQPSLPSIPPGPQRLDRGIIKAWYLTGLLTMALFVGGAAASEYFLLQRNDWWPLPLGVVTGLVFAVMLWLELWYPRRAWRAWTWELREHDVLLAFGIFWQTKRSVPRLRIQHVDVSRDPVDRLLGLASVTLYTAGSGSEDAQVPGLSPATAEALREALLIHKDAAEEQAARVADDDLPGQLQLFSGAADAAARARADASTDGAAGREAPGARDHD